MRVLLVVLGWLHLPAFAEHLHKEMQEVLYPTTTREKKKQCNAILVTEFIVKVVAIVSILCFLLIWIQVNYGVAPGDMVNWLFG